MIELQAQHAFAGGFALDVDLRLPAQGLSVLFGPSGCGKTTLLRCLAGLQRPAQGRIAVGGQLWQDASHFVPTHQRAVGMVFQEASLFPHLTVQGNLDFGLTRAQRAAPAQATRAREQLAQAVELLGLAPLLARRPQALSGGERQRVAIARALATAPRLLLMDEPLAALDARRKQEFLPFLERLHRELTLPVVYVTHAMAEVMRLADHLVVLEAGRARASGPLFETLSRLDVPQLAQDEAAGVVLPCTVGARDATWQLARLDLQAAPDTPPLHLWARDQGHALGQQVRVQVLARDVSLALHEPQASSIANVLPGTLEALADDLHPAQQLALVRVGSVRLMSRLTRRSVHQLGLHPGQALWAQVKAVAVVA